MQAAATDLQKIEGVIEGVGVGTLNAIWSPDCGVAIYQRQIGAVLQNWLDGLSVEKLPKARLSMKITQVRATIGMLMEENGLADDPCSQILVNDVTYLTQHFANIMKVNTINLRLDVVDDNACRKFHQDYVKARLLCTYRGKGTEYGLCVSDSEPTVINELSRGSVGIFKGRRWPDASPPAIYHRSPQIEGTGETRLLLVIDVGTCDNDCCAD